MDTVEEPIAVTYDIGGTTASASLVCKRNILTPIRTTAYQPGHTEKQLRGLSELVKSDAKDLGREILCGGIGMPSPSDFEKGILLTTHKPRLKELYGKSMVHVLGIPPTCKLFFADDGSLLTQGAIEMFPDEPRLLVVGLGTGIGSGYASNNRFLPFDKTVHLPLWELPFRDGTLEDYVSQKAIIREFEALGGEKGMDVKEIAARAATQHKRAQHAFQIFWKTLGEGLAIVSEKFLPTRIVFAGKIGIGTFDQFSLVVKQSFEKNSHLREVLFSKATTDTLPLLGAAVYAQKRYGAG